MPTTLYPALSVPPPPAQRSPLFRLLAAAAAAVLLSVTVSAGTAVANESTEGGHHTLRISSPGERYVLDGHQVSAGLVTTTLHNTDPTSPHQAQIAKLKPGASVADFGAAIAAHNVPKAFGMLAGFYGGPNVVPPGGQQRTQQNLTAGTYVLLCFVPDSMTGAPHFAMGMFAGFDVVGVVDEPDSPHGVSATVLAVDEKRFVIPATLDSGTTIRFQNHAKVDVHEFTIGKLLPGKTRTDVVTWVKTHQGPPPFTFVGGNGALNPGGTGWFKLDVPDGNYVAFCLVPDDLTGVPHAADGMVAAFTVT